MVKKQLVELEEQAPEESYSDKRANAILEVIMSYARLDFKNKIKVTGDGDVFDAISSGVNMLGEELESSSISLKEKEQLLKEIHHRVKNNLQIIYSLLNLQAQNTTDEVFLGMIRESKNRISSMALVHEMLYATKNISHICACDYITQLTKNIFHSFSLDHHTITINYQIDEKIYFEIDKMIPIGLILNEIVSNSLKYAFPDHKGEIYIHFRKEKDCYVLTVKDNGIGIPKDFNYQNSNSLGIQLIHVLSEQIDGKLILENKKGTEYNLSF